MFPSITIFGKEIYMYAIAALAGIFASGIYACRTAKKLGHSDNDMIAMGMFALLGAFIGGHLLYGITNIKYIVYYMENTQLITSFSDFWDVFTYIFGGMVFYGGLIGGFFGAVIYGRVKKLPLSDFSDILAPAVPLFHVFGRIGCFLGGCCYGIESSFGFISHQAGSPMNDGLRHFPVQLCESLFNLILFIVLSQLLRRGKWRGRLFSLYILAYSAGRFGFEFLRGDSYRGFLFGLSTSQLISILLFICAAVYLIIYASRHPKAEAQSGHAQ